MKTTPQLEEWPFANLLFGERPKENLTPEQEAGKAFLEIVRKLPKKPKL